MSSFGCGGIALAAVRCIDIGKEEYLENVVFRGIEGSTLAPDSNDIGGYTAYLNTYSGCLLLEHCAIECVK